MSTTLNFADHLLSFGSKLQDMGRKQDAMRVLGRLSRMRDLPSRIVHESRRRLGELYMDSQRFPEARKHLRVALATEPEDCETHYLMAQSHEMDERGDAHKALAHYRQALAADGDQPYCLADYGRLALDHGKTEKGLAALRKAAELAPDDAEILGQLVNALVECDQLDEARRVARNALFGHSRDAGFRKVWSDLQFQELRLSQQRFTTNRASKHTNDPVILPYLGVTKDEPATPVGSKIIRHDGPSLPRPPHAPRLGIYSDKKHA